MIDVLIITHNEALNLPHCLASIQGWTNRIYVIDSGSTDGTQDIARSFGAEVVEHAWEGYARQRNWALSELEWESPWTLILDADEMIPPDVRSRLEEIASHPVDSIREDGFLINRLTFFMDQPIRRCGYYPSYHLRFIKRGRGSYEDREVHEHVVMTGPRGYVSEPMLHHDRRGLEHYVAKHNRYSTLEAQALFREIVLGDRRQVSHMPAAARRRRWLKKNVMPRAPFSGLWRFLYMYVFRLGVLDGRVGLEFCRFISMYDSLVSLKLRDLRRRARTGGVDAAAVAASGLATPEGVQVAPTPAPATAGAARTGGGSGAQGPKIVGVSVFHGDAAAAGLIDGQLVTGVEEERFRRIKHWAGFPCRALNHCLAETTGGDLRDLDALAVARQPRAHFWRKALVTLTHPSLVPHATNRVKAISRVNTLEQSIASCCGVAVNEVPKLHRVEHHLSHIASSFFCSPFEEAMCLTVDGFGDFVSTMRAIGRGNRIEPLDRVFYPNSLGVFYTAITQYIGFPHYGDEYKMMGLAGYGEPNLADKLGQVVPALDNGQFRLDQKYFRLLREGVDMTWDDGEPDLGLVYTDALEKLLGQPPRKPDEELTQFHKDVAASAQRVYEQRFFNLVRTLQKMTGLKTLALAGGCALNSLANGRLLEQSDIQDVFIQPAAGDGGTSLGAALYVHHSVLGYPRQFVMTHSCWGPQFEDGDIRQAIAEGIPDSGGRDGAYGDVVVETADGDQVICDRIAQAIADGQVVGWYQGRSEWGPRALGNRSILADPRRDDMQETLNVKIKRRESFRPFAPSILEERVSDWFTLSYPDPFMLKVYPIKPDRQSQIPAVTHVDGTGRLQTVSAESRPLYHRLISAFEQRTGVPIILNTSFNENEPIVNTPGEALACFLRTKMDWLVLNNVLIHRT
ncbi:MAG: hypothetical protein CMJ18_18230 [Phycisphaeraceae bacterium]|nr:hypothetical protein [Phycisphaeraceae bacterium]